ncbi:hypothetical protein B0T17DRAFT_620799 [Bombardia bombarda]|uniref:SRR1-like domain-containing protein n=1 Tax=Bombardia bombarda TaxID=252184 RepID=A0AA39WBM8_9PEZI|nr:hypothetical protein B0T17DRAFT_620799 [Bombardia bombarda]
MEATNITATSDSKATTANELVIDSIEDVDYESDMEGSTQSISSVDHEARQVFQKYKDEWEASEQRRALWSALSNSTVEIGPVNKIVAFACSSLSCQQKDDERKDRDRTAAVQHALILTLHEFFQSRIPSTGPAVQCFAQDPAYTNIDREILGEVGITVLEDPHAFLELDETSVVISISPDIPVREVTADLARPAMMIWDQVIWDQVEEEPDAAEVNAIDRQKTSREKDPDLPRLKKMTEDHYVETSMPRYHDSFGSGRYHASIYIRKTTTTPTRSETAEGGGIG